MSGFYPFQIPVSAREWLRQYFVGVKTVYTFRLFGEQIHGDGWPVLGRIQNLLANLLDGIVQADKEGFYNECSLPAATLNEKGQWITFPLSLTDPEAIERFKEGIIPRRGFLSRLLQR